ncbi:uncharacterized protein [Paramisgurnus dabryanus]|uniref:uncharacterized protein n=1 Tax=Paramisgurnus dabryanus TaxID=90735 RepID=UPI003CCF0AD0
MTSETASGDSTPTVVALLFLLLILVLVLVFLYKKLNKETNGQYKVNRIIFAEGGLRDQLRERVEVVENRFGVHLWPQTRTEEEEGLKANDEEEADKDKDNESHADEGEEEDTHNKDDSSDDYSSIDLRERANQKKEENNDEKTEVEEDKKKPTEEAAGEADKPKEELKNEENVKLLVDFKPFGGSATWSEQNKEEENDLTAL